MASYIVAVQKACCLAKALKPQEIQACMHEITQELPHVSIVKRAVFATRDSWRQALASEWEQVSNLVGNLDP
jgi:hypothetical protein